jgi:hypothetical protein
MDSDRRGDFVKRLLAPLFLLVALAWAPAVQSVPSAWGAVFNTFQATNSSHGPGSGTETIPVGAGQVIIEDCGAGGGGGSNPGTQSAGGGSGGYVKKTFTLTPANWGQTFTYVAQLGGAGGASGGVNAGSPAGASTVANGTFPTATSLSAGGGGGGSGTNNPAGGGGAASGGDVNTPGNAGQNGVGGGGGGAGVAGIVCTSGVGGFGGEPGSGQPGGNATIVFEYT